MGMVFALWRNMDARPADTGRPPRRLPVGAEVVPGGVHFRVWAPRRKRVEIVLECGTAAGTHPLTPEPDGYHSILVPGAAAGDCYRYRLDGGDAFPDPAS